VKAELYFALGGEQRKTIVGAVRQFIFLYNILLLDLSFLFLDGNIIAAHLPFLHEAVGVKGPVFDPIGAEPLSLFVSVFVLKVHSDLVVSKAEQFLLQAIIQLLRPLLCQEGFNLCPPLDESVSVTPPILCVNLRKHKGDDAYTESTV